MPDVPHQPHSRWQSPVAGRAVVRGTAPAREASTATTPDVAEPAETEAVPDAGAGTPTRRARKTRAARKARS